MSDKLEKKLLLAGKIALGSSLAIYTAELLQLQFSASAGIVAMLTLITTKKGTVRLSAFRLLSFALTSVLAWVTFVPIQCEWIAYGVFIFVLVLLSEAGNWRATLSVNAVIGTHFLMTGTYTPAFFLNEFLLVAIGVLFAFVLNLFHNNYGQKERLQESIHEIEGQIQRILEGIAAYLSQTPQDKSVWAEISRLERRLQTLIQDACEYEGNTFGKEAAYFSRYFEMRLSQCQILHSLHQEMGKMRTMPRQAEIIVQYILYLTAFVTELNEPTPQLAYLEDLFAKMKREPLPTSREEFESRAMLYHILMDLEEFLLVKARFVKE